MSDSDFDFERLGFTSTQANRMTQYLTPQDTYFFQNEYNLYQLLYLLRTLTPTQVFQYLESLVRDDVIIPNEFYFQSPQYQKVREATARELYLLQDELKSTDGKPCKWCGSAQVITTFKQTRSADEPMTEITECLACKKRQ